MKNTKGFPRPNLPLNGKNTPLPWVGGNYPEEEQWARVDTVRAYGSEVDKLCIVCGLDLPPENPKADKDDDFIFMLVNGEDYSETTGLSLFGQLPSPTWVHPKCGRIAALFCPHLKRQEYPAMRQNGQRLSQEELSELAKGREKVVQ